MVRAGYEVRSGMRPTRTRLADPGKGGSRDWTRTNNLPVNSRLLCQLSYAGPPPPRGNPARLATPDARCVRTLTAAAGT